MEALRDRIMHGLGTDEPWHMEHMGDVAGLRAIAVHFRRPLRIDEVNQMAPTEEVRARPETTPTERDTGCSVVNSQAVSPTGGHA